MRSGARCAHVSPVPDNKHLCSTALWWSGGPNLLTVTEGANTGEAPANVAERGAADVVGGKRVSACGVCVGWVVTLPPSLFFSHPSHHVCPCADRIFLCGPPPGDGLRQRKVATDGKGFSPLFPTAYIP